MHRQGCSSVAIACFALVVVISISPIAHVASVTQGYAAYEITLTNGSHSKSFTVSENVQPSPASGLSILTITLAGGKENLTFSKTINSSSSLLFPILPITNNQSLVYQSQNYSVSLTINRTGSSSVNFNGSTYQLANYNFNGSFKFLNYSSKSINGQISVLPSDLVYSAQVRLNQTTLKIQLLATNLSLDPAAGPQGVEETIAFSAVGATAALLGVVYAIRKFMRKSAKQSSPSGGKPSYWVD